MVLRLTSVPVGLLISVPLPVAAVSVAMADGIQLRARLFVAEALHRETFKSTKVREVIEAVRSISSKPSSSF